METLHILPKLVISDIYVATGIINPLRACAARVKACPHYTKLNAH